MYMYVLYMQTVCECLRAVHYSDQVLVLVAPTLLTAFVSNVHSYVYIRVCCIHVLPSIVIDVCVCV